MSADPDNPSFGVILGYQGGDMCFDNNHTAIQVRLQQGGGIRAHA